jgi:hypothetical protein
VAKVDFTKLLPCFRFIHPRENITGGIHGFNRRLQFKQLVRSLFFNFIGPVIDTNIGFLEAVPLLALVVNSDVASALGVL